MQTFLPYANFQASAKALDNKRLGKQRVEVLQILRALTGQSKGWTNHPATRMWAGYEDALVIYGIEICLEWRRRGFNDTCLEKIAAFYSGNGPDAPVWVGDPKVHIAHQSNLRRKDPEFYGPMFPGVPDDLPYVWPDARKAAA